MNCLKTFLLIILCTKSTLSFSIDSNSSPISYNTITIPLNHYGVDASKNLIVINQDINIINLNYPGVKNQIDLDLSYTFLTPVSIVNIGMPYTVTNPSNVSFTLYFTELPLVFINTQNTIVNTPSVGAELSLIEQNGTFVFSDISIEFRGAFALSLPKKSYEFKFYTDNTLTNKKDFSLLGMREDNDWILQSQYLESLRTKSKVGFDLWRQIHTLYYQNDEPDAVSGIHLEFIELFINGSYQGMYALGEKSDRKQLKLKKEKNGIIRGELYKGYQGNKFGYFRAIDNSYDNNNLFWNSYEYKYPDDNIDWVNFHSFVDFIVNEPDASFYNNIGSKFHIDNAIDYFIFINLIGTWDNFANNTYIAKYKVGEPYFYSPWDLDLSFDFLRTVAHQLISSAFYNRLLLDVSANGFKEKLITRWAALRANGVITNANIMNMFSNNVTYLENNGVYNREQLAWSNYTYNPTDFQSISTWLNDRISFLDSEFSIENKCKTTISLGEIYRENGWVYFGLNSTKGPLFAIEYNPIGVGANTSTFSDSWTKVVVTSIEQCNIQTFSKTLEQNSTLAMGYYWNFIPFYNNYPINGWVNIRWFKNGTLEQKLISKAQEKQTNTGALGLSPIMNLKTTERPLYLPQDIRTDGKGLNVIFEPLLNTTTGTHNGLDYVQYNNIDDLSNSGGGMFISVANNNDTDGIAPGTIRYNNALQKFQGYNGTQWVDFN